MSLVPRLSAEWRAALAGTAVGVVLSFPAGLKEGAGLIVAGVVAGYFASEDVDAYAAGARAGALTALPLLVWFLVDSTAWFASRGLTVGAVGGGLLVAASVLGLGYIAGGLGAGVGGWLAVQFGRKEPA